MLVATYNAHRGRSPTGLFRPERIAAVIAEIRPDLVTLQEAQHYLDRRRPMLDSARLARECGLRPLPVADGEQGWRSNVVLVRHDAVLLRPAEGLRLGGLEPRGGILAELDLGWGPFRLLAAHLSLGATRRQQQARLLLKAARAAPPLPVLLLGDLNEWRPQGSALAELAPFFGPPPLVPTFPWFRPRLALDHVLGHPRGLVVTVSAHDTSLARRASDHLPLVARIDTALLRAS